MSGKSYPTVYPAGYRIFKKAGYPVQPYKIYTRISSTTKHVLFFIRKRQIIKMCKDNRASPTAIILAERTKTVNITIYWNICTSTSMLLSSLYGYIFMFIILQFLKGQLLEKVKHFFLRQSALSGSWKAG